MAQYGSKVKHERCTLIRRDENIKENHYQVLDENYKITKPTIICLGGNCTLTTKDANAMCKIAQRISGLKHPTTEGEFATTEDVDIVGVKYGLTYNKYGKPEKVSELCWADVQNITSQLLAPLVFDNGQKMDVTSACKSISNVTFLSHSIGTKQIGKIVACFYKTLVEGGYKEDEISQIIGNITTVNFAPETTVSTYLSMQATKGIPTPQQFNIKSIKDFPANFDYDRETGKDFRDLKGLEFVPSKHCSNEVTLYCNDFESGDDHMIHNVIHRSENWESTSWNKDEHGNHFPVSEKSDAASQCAGFILSLSVANGLQNNQTEEFIQKPTMEKSIEDCKDIVSQFDEVPVA